MSIFHLFTGCSLRVTSKCSKALSDQLSFFICFLIFILLVNVIISNVLILLLLMQTVTVYVVCVITFIVQTSDFFTFLLLGRWICGIPATSFCSLAIPFIFSFSIIVVGILEQIIYFNFLCLLVAFFRRWRYFSLVSRINYFPLKTIFSLVICDFHTSFCMLFHWIYLPFLKISCDQLN